MTQWSSWLCPRSGVAIKLDHLDADPWLLNVANGTLDLRTGTLHPHRREDLVTELAPAAYDAHATCPMWDKFLHRVLNDDEALIGFLRRAVGYGLTGDTTEQVLFFLYGSGANGKGTFLVALQEMLGDYAKQAAPEVLLVHRGEQHPTGVADLLGARFVVAAEVEQGKAFAESLVKQLTGGDRLKARLMRQDCFEFSATHKIFLAANHKPIVYGTDYAIWRRIRLVPFTVTIPPEERDPHLVAKLRTEWPGILAWAVRGCREWQERGLGVPGAVKAATEAYQAEMDTLGEFIAARCDTESGCKATAKELYDSYTYWCEAEGGEPITQRAFGTALGERGFQRVRSDHSKPTTWRGIRPKTARTWTARSA